MSYRETQSKPYPTSQQQKWMKVDQNAAARLCINSFIQNYKRLKNRKKTLYSSVDDLNLNSDEGN